MPSPVPKPASERRRRNRTGLARADHLLPASGRRGRPPKPPVALGLAGQQLWSRLWTSPQATTWTRAHLDGVAARCRLEDLLSDGSYDPLKVMAQIQSWEDRWGFNPRGLAQLHQWIQDDDDAPAAKPERTVTDIRDRLRDAAG